MFCRLCLLDIRHSESRLLAAHGHSLRSFLHSLIIYLFFLQLRRLHLSFLTFHLSIYLPALSGSFANLHSLPQVFVANPKNKDKILALEQFTDEKQRLISHIYHL
jgi:hypothetical protein